MSTANPEIREYLRIKQIPLWEAFLNVCENTIIRWLRLELSAEKQAFIYEAANTVLKKRYKK